MNINILEHIKQTLYRIRRAKHKPMPMVEEKIVKKKEMIVKKKREQIKAIVNEQELSLKEIADKYNLDLRTVRARHKVGNKGKLLIRPTNRKKPT